MIIELGIIILSYNNASLEKRPTTPDISGSTDQTSKNEDYKFYRDIIDFFS